MPEIIEALNWADWLLLAIVFVSMVVSIKRGMTREILSLLTWLGAFIIAYIFSEKLALLMTDWIKTPSVRTSVAVLLLFAMTLVVGAMLNNVLADLLSQTGLTGTDRVLGSLFGAVRGVVIVVGLLLFVRSSFSLDLWWKQSVLIPYGLQIGTWSQDTIDSARQLIQQLIAK